MTDCVLWKGATFSWGYGCVRLGDGRRRRAHRVFYMLYNGPIPPGCDVHHVCGNRLCVNPAHLIALPHAEHTVLHSPKRGYRQPACKRGHAFTPENTERPSPGKRRCITCRRMRDNARYALRRESA